MVSLRAIASPALLSDPENTPAIGCEVPYLASKAVLFLTKRTLPPEARIGISPVAKSKVMPPVIERRERIAGAAPMFSISRNSKSFLSSNPRAISPGDGADG